MTERLHFTHFLLYPWRRKWQPTPVVLPGESHGQRSLAGSGPLGHRESDTTELTKNARMPGSYAKVGKSIDGTKLAVGLL